MASMEARPEMSEQEEWNALTDAQRAERILEIAKMAYPTVPTPQDRMNALGEDFRAYEGLWDGTIAACSMVEKGCELKYQRIYLLEKLDRMKEAHERATKRLEYLERMLEGEE